MFEHRPGPTTAVEEGTEMAIGMIPDAAEHFAARAATRKLWKMAHERTQLHFAIHGLDGTEMPCDTCTGLLAAEADAWDAHNGTDSTMPPFRLLEDDAR